MRVNLNPSTFDKHLAWSSLIGQTGPLLLAGNWYCFMFCFCFFTWLDNSQCHPHSPVIVTVTLNLLPSSRLISLQKQLFTRHTHEEKKTVKGLGLDRPELLQQQAVYKGRAYTQGFSHSCYEKRSWAFDLALPGHNDSKSSDRPRHSVARWTLLLPLMECWKSTL